MAHDVVERYGATPYAFRFSTRSRGGADLDSKESASSPLYHLGGRVETLEEVEARNDPKDGDFYVRNPNAWRKAPSEYGADAWVRVSRHSYGWFKLAEHPRHEVEHLMTGGTPEREAWKVTLDRLDGLVEKLAAGDLTAVVISVTVYWNDEVVGDTVLGGIETDEYVDEAATVRLAEEHDLIDEALGYAKKKIERACKTAMLADRPEGATNAA